MVLLKRTLEQGTKWIPSLIKYGAASTCFMLYFTEWRLVLEHVPIYNAKFKVEE